MPPDLAPRLAAPGDLAHVQAVTRAAYDHYTPLFGAPPLPVTEDYRPRIDRGEVWLLGDAGLIVLERHPDHAMIFSLAVAPQAQGTGLGSRLLDLAEQTARGWGLAEIRLYTNALMARNLAMYAARGYRETGRRSHELRPGFTLVDMVKTLPPTADPWRR